MVDYYVIQEGYGTMRGEPNTYWSNLEGWVGLGDATMFTLDEINSFQYLPFGSSHVVKLPTRKHSKKRAKL